MPHLNEQFGIFPSAAYTASQNGDPITNYGFRGCRVQVNITANPGGSGSITANIVEIVGGQKRTILSSGPLTAVAVKTLTVHPDIPQVPNSIAQDSIGRVIEVDVVANNTNPITYDVSFTSLM